LIRWERQGLAFKARYETRHPKQDKYDKFNASLEAHNPNLPKSICPTGVHRVRWVIFSEALNEK